MTTPGAVIGWMQPIEEVQDVLRRAPLCPGDASVAMPLRPGEEPAAVALAFAFYIGRHVRQTAEAVRPGERGSNRR